MTNLYSTIKNFITDERGSEATEVGVTTVVLAGGSASQLSGLKTAIQTKVQTVNEVVSAVDVN